MMTLFSVFRVVSILLLVGTAPLSLAQDVADIPSDDSQRLEQRLSAFEGFSAQFEQITTDADGEELERLTGQMKTRRPNFFMWRVVQPWPQTLIGDGQQLFFYDPDLEQVEVRSWSNNPMENPAMILVSPALLANHFDVKAENSSSESEQYILTAKHQGGHISELHVVFEKGLPVTIRFQDMLGQTTELIFSDVDISVLPDMRHFEFILPSDVDVIYAE